MAGKVRIEMNSAGIEELLGSPKVVADQLRRGLAIAEACGDGYSARLSDAKWRGRHRVWVGPDSGEAHRDNAENGTLLGNLDAGRS